MRMQLGNESQKFDGFEIKPVLRQEHGILPWLFNIFMDQVLRETRAVFEGSGYK